MGIKSTEATAPRQGDAVGFDIDAECRRLLVLEKEMDAISEALLALPNQVDDRVIKRRLFEISLKALEIEDSDGAAMSAKKRYHVMAKQLHPDRCKHADAPNAFAALGRAMSVILSSEDRLETSSAIQGSNGVVNPNSLIEGQDDGQDLISRDFQEHLKWNQSRLVVPAYALQPGKFPDSRIARYDDSHLEIGNLVFVPLDAIPTLKSEKRRQLHALSVDDAAEVANLVDELLHRAESASGDGRSGGGWKRCAPIDDEVEGLILVAASTVLKNSFPLGGTYFQINEVFCDYSTVTRPVQVSFWSWSCDCPGTIKSRTGRLSTNASPSNFVQLPRSLLDDSQACAVYFGHGIHYMSKAMSQHEVTHMFSCQSKVCFRAFQGLGSRAPLALPRFLLPSIPNPSKSTWKSAQEKKAASVSASLELQRARSRRYRRNWYASCDAVHRRSDP